MSDQTISPKLTPGRRASLRGRGWEILRGQPPPPAGQPAEPLTPPAPEEGLPGAEAAPALELAAAPELAKLRGSPPPASVVPPTEEVPPQRMAVVVEPEAEAIPWVETTAGAKSLQSAIYTPPPEVEALVPEEPETILPEGEPTPAVEDEAAAGGQLQIARQPFVLDDLSRAGIVIQPQDARIDAGELAPAGGRPRPQSGELFAAEREIVPSQELLARFVTDERLEALWQEIERLQAALPQRLKGLPARADAYQRELLQASALLLQNRANYDDVRAIITRLQVDLARDEQIEADIRRYKPRLLLYLILVLVLWVILMLLEPIVARSLGDGLGMQAISAVYHPTLFGVLGAILRAYFTLNKHTVQLRDFDPAHLSWYIMNPVIGGVMGLLMTLVFGAGIVSTVGLGALEQVQPEVVGQYPFLLWVLCVVAGYNQNVVLRLLARLLRGTGQPEDEQAARPAGSENPSEQSVGD